MKQLLILSLIAMTSFTPTSFEADQQRYERVRQAYADKEKIMKVQLKKERS